MDAQEREGRVGGRIDQVAAEPKRRGLQGVVLATEGDDLVAGLRAGKIYNTWPDIDGGLIPSAARLFFDTPWWRNLFENTLTVQFEHRMVAYTLFVLAALHVLDAVLSRADRAVIGGALWLLGAVTLQATLGILTLLHQVPMDLALTHQAVAIIVLTLVVFQAERLTRDPARFWDLDQEI